MKFKSLFVALSILLISCVLEKEKPGVTENQNSITGTWQLLKGTTITNGDTAVTDYTQNTSFIKIINDTHFAFLHHDLTKGKDSAAVFVSGGGTYSLNNSSYTENLQYCSAREWEGNDFAFTITINNDTLTQQGIEKVESAGVDRMNIEQYIRVKK